ncbi:unnamed protein product [Lupinus luteus]|uniref:Uncharacterized protein n=1 Tax=Lupinus luteus TaxID=3873 RepID=A0AAV1XA64_LUPLU
MAIAAGLALCLLAYEEVEEAIFVQPSQHGKSVSSSRNTQHSVPSSKEVAPANPA